MQINNNLHNSILTVSYIFKSMTCMELYFFMLSKIVLFNRVLSKASIGGFPLTDSLT